MIIDFHTHIFPDKVAAKAIPKLASVIKITPSNDGTLSGLLKTLSEAGIDLGVVLPTVTDPHQFPSVIKFACQLNEHSYEPGTPRVFSLAGIHPDSPDYAADLREIKRLGFPGVKIHPDYQGVLFNDIRYKRILYKASELDLFIITHAGYDVYSPGLVHCPVSAVTEVLDEVRPRNLVLAHMGNNMFYDQVEESLLGRDVYLDTSFTITNLEPERIARMIRVHGADKVLFGTDSPWTQQTEAVKTFRTLGFSREEEELMLHKNAERLLGIGGGR